VADAALLLGSALFLVAEASLVAEFAPAAGGAIRLSDAAGFDGEITFVGEASSGSSVSSAPFATEGSSSAATFVPGFALSSADDEACGEGLAGTIFDFPAFASGGGGPAFADT
jgi:hypothetical protein